MLIFSYPSALTYVLGAQKNRLIETVLLSTHNICFGWEIRKLNFRYTQKSWVDYPLNIDTVSMGIAHYVFEDATGQNLNITFYTKKGFFIGDNLISLLPCFPVYK